MRIDPGSHTSTSEWEAHGSPFFQSIELIRNKKRLSYSIIFFRKLVRLPFKEHTFLL